jgi:DNA processing protein
VSGLAFGIDAAAHEAALEAGGVTVGVLASGIDDRNISPKSHFGLARRIMENGGAIVSERPPLSVPSKRDFPVRNRIIAGLSLGTAVLEAARRSGALITARAALEYDREVFALPGPIFSPASAGVNAIIAEGAVPITSEKTLLDRFGLSPVTRPTEEPRDLTAAESTVLKTIIGRMTIDEIVERSGLATDEACAGVSGLEMKGLLSFESGGKYEKN